MSKTKKTNRKRKPINTYYPVCPICGSELIWGGDHDISEEHEEHTILSNLSCTNKECNATVEVSWGGQPQIETGSHTPRKTKNGKNYWIVEVIDSNNELTRIRCWGIKPEKDRIHLNRPYMARLKYDENWGFSTYAVGKTFRLLG